MFSPPSQYTVAVCNQITLLILYYNSSRLVSLLKAPDIFGPTVSFMFLNFCFQIFRLFVSEVYTSFTFYIVTLSTVLWFGSCNHCILACFFRSNKPQHTSSHHGLCCFNSYRHRKSSAEVLIFRLMFSQALFMSSLHLSFQNLQTCWRSESDTVS